MVLSALGRFRGRVLGLAVLLTLVQFVINLLGQMWDVLEPLRPLTVFYYYKSLGIFSEYVRTTQSVIRSGATGTFTNTGWDVSGSFLLTGEAASTGITRPQRVFDPQKP